MDLEFSESSWEIWDIDISHNLETIYPWRHLHFRNIIDVYRKEGDMGPMVKPPNDLPMRNDALWTLGATIGLDIFVTVDMGLVGKINVSARNWGDCKPLYFWGVRLTPYFFPWLVHRKVWSAENTFIQQIQNPSTNPDSFNLFVARSCKKKNGASQPTQPCRWRWEHRGSPPSQSRWPARGQSCALRSP